MLRLRRGCCGYVAGGFYEVQIGQRSRLAVNIKGDESGANARFMPQASFRPQLRAEACFGELTTRTKRAVADESAMRGVSPQRGSALSPNTATDNTK